MSAGIEESRDSSRAIARENQVESADRPDDEIPRPRKLGAVTGVQPAASEDDIALAPEYFRIGVRATIDSEAQPLAVDLHQAGSSFESLRHRHGSPPANATIKNINRRRRYLELPGTASMAMSFCFIL
jgi:hypothetical protein